MSKLCDLDHSITLWWDKGLTTAAIAKKLKKPEHVICNRINDLRDMGKVQRKAPMTLDEEQERTLRAAYKNGTVRSWAVTHNQNYAQSYQAARLLNGKEKANKAYHV